MAVGAGVGTYPEANYIGVKVLPEPVPGVRPKLSAEEVTKSWIYVFDDVINNNRQGKTVINWSISMSPQLLVTLFGLLIRRTCSFTMGRLH